MDRNQKQELVDALREELLQAPSVVVTSSVGISSNQMNDLRSKLRATGSRYRVVKNTLLRRATEGTSLENVATYFTGPTAIVYNTEDAVVAAKVVVDYAEKNDKLVLKGGWLNGTVLDPRGVEQLSKMPGKDELRAKLLMVFNGVGTKVVRVLAAGPTSFLNVLNARRDALGG